MSDLNVQLISDLHFEFELNYLWLAQNTIRPVAPILVIAGDMSSGSTPAHVVMTFLKYCSENWEHVIVLLGNHEFYQSAEPLDSVFPSFERKFFHNVTVVNNRTLTIEGVPFICSTLWTRIQPQNEVACLQGIRDFMLIEASANRRLTPFAVNEFHTTSMIFIEREVAKYDRCVVLTHHAPSLKCNHPKYIGHPTNDSFVNNLDRFIGDHPQIRLWMYGHTHHPMDIMIGDTRVVNNGLGNVMRDEHRDFKTDAFWRVPNDHA